MMSHPDSGDELAPRVLRALGRDRALTPQEQQRLATQLAAALDALPSPPPRVSSTDRPASRRFIPRAVYAALGAVTILMIAWVLHIAGPSTTVPSPSRLYTTTTGQRAEVRLEDGSRILLAPRTELRLTTEGTARIATLSGEAHFTIASAARQPFVVRAGNATARVLGTSFDVRHYNDEREVRVAVISGRVAVASTAFPVQSATLAAGSAARVTDSTVVTIPVVDMTSYVAWTHGQLDFVNTPLPGVLDEIGRWYGYQFRLGDSALVAEHLTARLDYASKADLFKALEALLSVSVSFDTHNADTVVVLHRRQKTYHAPMPRNPSHVLSTSAEVGR